MRPSIHQQRTLTGSHRLLSGVGVLVFFGAFFVMPLCAALLICAMPCCEHDGGSGAAPIVSAGMTACATECSVREAEASLTVIPPVMPESGADRNVPAATAVAAMADRPPIAAAGDSHDPGSARGSDAPLHILNSTFRI